MPYGEYLGPHLPRGRGSVARKKSKEIIMQEQAEPGYEALVANKLAQAKAIVQFWLGGHKMVDADWSFVISSRKRRGKRVPWVESVSWLGQPFPDAFQAGCAASWVLSCMPALEQALASKDGTTLWPTPDAIAPVLVRVQEPATELLSQLYWVNAEQVLQGSNTQPLFQLYSQDLAHPLPSALQPPMRLGDVLASLSLGEVHALADVRLCQDLPWMYGIKFHTRAPLSLIIRAAYAAELHVQKYYPQVEELRRRNMASMAYDAELHAMAQLPAAVVLDNRAHSRASASEEVAGYPPAKRLCAAATSTDRLAYQQLLPDGQSSEPTAAASSGAQPNAGKDYLTNSILVFDPAVLAAGLIANVAGTQAQSAAHQVVSMASLLPGMQPAPTLQQTGVQQAVSMSCDPATAPTYHAGNTGAQLHLNRCTDAGLRLPLHANQVLPYAAVAHSPTASALTAPLVTQHTGVTAAAMQAATDAHAAVSPPNVLQLLDSCDLVQAGPSTASGLPCLPEPALQPDGTLTAQCELQAVNGLSQLLDQTDAALQLWHRYNNVYSSSITSRRELASNYRELHHAVSTGNLARVHEVLTQRFHLDL